MNGRRAGPAGPADRLLGVQRGVLVAALVANGAVFWRGAVDIFAIPRATLLVAGTVVLGALSVVRAVRTGRLVVPRSPVVTLAALFAAALVLSLAAGGDVMRSLVGPYTRYTGVAMYATYAALMVLVVRLHDRESVPQLAWAIVTALAVVAVYGVVQYADADPFDWPQAEDEARRFGVFDVDFSTLGNIDFSAAFVGIGAPLALWAALSGRHRPHMRALGAIVLAAAAVYGFGSEAFQGPVTLVAGCAVVAVAFVSTRWRPWHQLGARSRRLLATTVAALVLVLVALAPAMAARTVDEFANTGGRTTFWGTAADIWLDAPLTGGGLGVFYREFTARRPGVYAAEQKFLIADAPHNVLLELLAGGGLLLALPYLGIVGGTAWVLVGGLRRSEGEDRLLLGAFGGSWLAYQLQSTVSLDVPALASLHWVVTGAVWVLAAPPVLVTRPLVRRVAGTSRWGRAAAEGGVAAVAAVAVWFASQPLRADLVAGRARDTRRPGHLEESAAHAERATELAPWEGTYWAFRAGALDRLGQLDEAFEAGVRAAREAPWSSGYALAVAGLAERRRLSGEAFQWLAEARARDPNNPDVLRVTARFHLKSGSADAARRALEHAVDVAPDEAESWLLLGDAYDALGQEAKAGAARARALQLESG